MEPDNEGFLYPKINQTSCVDCGLCERTCPVLNICSDNAVQRVIGAKHLNSVVRSKSSSGGLFTLIAEKIISQGGIVVGCVMNEELEAVHTIISTSDIYAYAKRRDLDVVYIGSQGVVDIYKREDASVHEWIWYIEHAEMIFTNSFHGTVFSLIFEKPFMTFPVYGVAKKMNDRILTLLNRVNLEDRVMKDSLNDVENEINYPIVSIILKNQAVRSGDSLLSRLATK